MDGEAILLVAYFGLFMYVCIRDIKTHQDRKSHEWWLSDVRDCIHSVECEFRRNCLKIAEEEFSQQKYSEYKYNVRISELKEKYKEELTEKIVIQKRVNITTVPEHLIREYERNISEIADTFCDFGNIMSEQ